MNPKDIQGMKKVPLTLLPTSALVHMAMCMKDGADKYGPFNWREKGKPVSTMIYIAAAQRHLLAYIDGEDKAVDSGHCHLAHAAASLAVLMDAIAVNNYVEDRPEPGPSPRLLKEYIQQIGPDDEFICIGDALTEKDMGEVLDEAFGVVTDCTFHHIPASGFPAKKPVTYRGIELQYMDSLSHHEDVKVVSVETGAPKAYLAGKMAHIPLLNFPAFDEHKGYLEGLGYDVISPADLDRAAGIDENDYPQGVPEIPLTSFQKEVILRRDTDAILSLTPGKDAIAMIPGWENSTGAVAEFFFARWHGLHVIDAEHGIALTADDIDFYKITSNMASYLRQDPS